MITNKQYAGPARTDDAVIIERADMRHVRMPDSKMCFAKLNRVDASQGHFERSNFDGLSARDSFFRGAKWDYASARRASLQRTDFTQASLVGVDFEGIDAHGACFNQANLRGANLREANLTFTDLGSADLLNVDLTCANFTGAELDRTDLSRANLREIRKDFFEILGCAGDGMIMMLRAALTLEDNNVVTIPQFGAHPSRPAERFFLALWAGLPRGNQPAAIAVKWIDEFFIGGQPRGS